MTNSPGSADGVHNPKPAPTVVMECFDDLTPDLRRALRDHPLDIDPRTVIEFAARHGESAALRALCDAPQSPCRDDQSR